MAIFKTTFVLVILVVFFEECLAYCGGDNDCRGTDVCCNNEGCSESCVGYDCVFDSDCGRSNEYCCNYTCQDGNCGLAVWIIVVIVLSVLILVTTIVVLLCCYFCSYRRRSPGLIVSAPPRLVPVASANTLITSNGVITNYGAVYAVQPQAPYTAQPPQTY